MFCGNSCSVEKVFLCINYVFAMYAGSLLITAIRLSLDPSTYTWFKFLFELQYKVTATYLYCLGSFLAFLIFLASSSVFPTSRKLLFVYMVGTVLVIMTEVAYSSWMYTSMVEWWRTSQQAELLRASLALQDDLKALLAVLHKYNQIAQEVTNAVHEVEEVAPKNGYVIGSCLVMSLVLQVVAITLSWILQRRAKRTMDWGSSNKIAYAEVASSKHRMLSLPDTE